MSDSAIDEIKNQVLSNLWKSDPEGVRKLALEKIWLYRRKSVVWVGLSVEQCMRFIEKQKKDLEANPNPSKEDLLIAQRFIEAIREYQKGHDSESRTHIDDNS